jgi:hypothetical protein
MIVLPGSLYKRVKSVKNSVISVIYEWGLRRAFLDMKNDKFRLPLSW